MRGILTIEPLYHQIVAGNKTQTRRSGGLEYVNENPDEWDAPVWVEERINKKTVSLVEFMRPGERGLVIQCAPRYKVGEVLCLKEPWTFLQSDTTDFWNGYAYRFGATSGCAISDRGAELGGTEIKFKNKLFMPSAAARAFIKITGIKCERLMDISESDCIAEGIERVDSFEGTTFYKYYTKIHDHGNATQNPKRSFYTLFCFANKIKGTDAMPNPWVFCYTFEYLPNYKLTK